MRFLLRRDDGIEQWVANRDDLKNFRKSSKLFVVAMQDDDGKELRQDDPSKQPSFNDPDKPTDTVKYFS